MAIAMMTKNEFEDCKQFLRLADNENFRLHETKRTDLAKSDLCLML